MNTVNRLREYVCLGRRWRREGYSLRNGRNMIGLKGANALAFEQGWLQADAELRTPSVFAFARFKVAKASHAWLCNARHVCKMHRAGAFLFMYHLYR